MANSCPRKAAIATAEDVTDITEKAKAAATVKAMETVKAAVTAGMEKVAATKKDK